MRLRVCLIRPQLSLSVGSPSSFTEAVEGAEMLNFRTRFGALCCVNFLACACFTEPRGCDLCTTAAIVYGRVQMAPGGPVAVARVSVDVRTPSCRSMSVGSIAAPTLTDSLGHYRLLALSPTGPTAVCLIVSAQPPTASGLATGADTGHVVRLEPTYPANQAFDSVQVDLVLPAVP
jgi:hypothetical protein